METLLSIKDIISNINKENIDQSAKSIINKFDNTYPIFFNTFITQIIYIIIITRMNEFDIYIVFLKEIEILEKDIKKFNEANILNIFTRFLMNKCTQESYYLLEKLVVNNLLPPTSVRNTLNLYFAHYMSKQEIKKSGYNEFKRRFEKNYEELSKNDWELHKQYVKEGVNPNEIAKIIRNDEIEKLQEMSSQNNFNFDRIIKPSLYERCDFINKENVSLIDYAAFFGSVKCFKYLLMNGANVENTGKYAIAGGNIEIIHLCEQNHSSFEKPYKTAIKFHRNDIFHYLYENKIEEIDSLENLGKKCILYHNYEIFMFLLEEGMEIDDEIINASATIENIYLTKYFLETHQIPENILAYSGNVEYVKYILEQEGIDINGKDIYMFYLMFT